MSEPITRLMSLKVSDVMAKSVVEISANQTMGEAAEKLAEHGVSAAPVTDEQGRCVGILSATDFLKRAGDQFQENEHSFTGESHQLTGGSGNEPLCLASVSENMVSCHMSGAVQSIAPDVSLLKAAQTMNAEHVHRLPVLDSDARVIGLISTMDVLAALLNSIDESAGDFIKQMRSGDF